MKKSTKNILGVAGVIGTVMGHAIDAFGRNAISFRLVPKRQCLPNVIIAPIIMLIVRRI